MGRGGFKVLIQANGNIGQTAHSDYAGFIGVWSMQWETVLHQADEWRLSKVIEHY